MIDNFLGKDWAEKFLDNSVKDRLPFNYADLVVFAGSPEWRGRRISSLYNFILDNNTPTIFLGLGAGSTNSLPLDSNNLSSKEIQVFKNAKLITCRDCTATQINNELNLFVNNLPCPALFSSKNNKKIDKVQKIALIYGTDKATKSNNVSKTTYDYMIKLYTHMLKKYKNIEFSFVAHYIDELSYFESDFPDYQLFYSYDSKDYLDIYNNYDLVIGYRVHGIGISASLGIPGIMIAHDSRSRTVNGFNAEIINVNDSLEIADNLISTTIDTIQEKNSLLLEHKNFWKQKYINLLNNSIVQNHK